MSQSPELPDLDRLEVFHVSLHGGDLVRLADVKALLARRAQPEGEAIPGKQAVFAIDLMGSPMREYAPGKWENAIWPSEQPEGEAPQAELAEGDTVKVRPGCRAGANEDFSGRVGVVVGFDAEGMTGVEVDFPDGASLFCTVAELERAPAAQHAESGAAVQPQNVSDERKAFDAYWGALESGDATESELEMCEYAAWQAWQARPRHCLALPLSAYPAGTTIAPAAQHEDSCALPPMPEPDVHAGDEAFGDNVSAFSAVAMQDYARAALAAKSQGARCSTCDGTGMVHRADGEYLGECTCEAAQHADSCAQAAYDQLESLVREYGNTPLFGPGRRRATVMAEIRALSAQSQGAQANDRVDAAVLRKMLEEMDVSPSKVAELRAALAAQSQGAQAAHPGLMAEIECLNHRIAVMKNELKMRHDKDTGDVWYWQGDGSDDPASMSLGMSVVINAADLRAAIAAKAEVPAHETIVQQADQLVCTACGTSAQQAAAPGALKPELMRQAVASVVSRAGDQLRIAWLRQERCDVGTLLYCAIEQPVAPSAPGTPEAPNEDALLLRAVITKGISLRFVVGQGDGDAVFVDDLSMWANGDLLNAARALIKKRAAQLDGGQGEVK